MMSTELESPTEQLTCPLCDYDLRGLVDPRCPECGYAFAWDELRDPTRRLHPYLFEHHPERNIWSFRRSVANSLLPRRFWRTLFPTQPSFPRRLLLYWAIVAAIAVTPFLLLLGYRMYEMDQRMRAVRARELSTMTPALRSHYVAQNGSVETFFERAYPVFPSGTYFRLSSIPNWWNLGGHAQVTAFALLWPWATFLSLMVFRASMRRARVRAVHVLRCVIYTADVAALAAAAVCVTWFFYDRWLGGTWSATWWRFGSARGVPIVVAVLFMILTYRLWIAYRRYLRFEHALATAIASQLMIALLTLKLIADFYSATRWGG